MSRKINENFNILFNELYFLKDNNGNIFIKN